VTLFGRRIRRLPLVLLGLLTAVVLGLWAVDGPAVLVGFVGFVLLVLFIMGRSLVSQTIRQGPAWSEDAQQSRDEVSEAAAQLSELRAQRERGEISAAELEARAAEILDTESFAEASRAIEQDDEGDDDPK
jgi:flagellar biosynthesis/type III secretory pathway M-ring protein FliF/YscJ